MGYWRKPDGAIIPAASWRPDLHDWDALGAANDTCAQRKMFWKAHSPTQFGDGDTDFWFSFDRVLQGTSAITWCGGWPRYGEYVGRGAILAAAICAALLALPKEATTHV